MSDAIFRIRHLIDALEPIKDQLVERFGALPVAPARRSFAIGDFKESYYNYVAAWQMLQGIEREDPKGAQENRDSSRKFLAWARDKRAQSASQVTGFNDPELARLGREFEVRAQRIEEAMEAHVRPAESVSLVTSAVLEVSPIHYQVHCSVCRKEAMFFKRQEQFGTEVVLFNGIASARHIDLAEAPRVFGLLKKADFPALHELMFEGYRFDGGLDGYCPSCDAIYCRTHYNVREYWDDGYYDYAMGTCPKGHEREVDD